MTLGQATAFTVFAVVAAITPGPSNLILTSTGASVGLLRGLPCLGGQVIGMGFMMFLVALGLGAVVLASPALFLPLKWAGVVFLLWLAWRIATADHSDAGAQRRVLGFWGAAAFQWINPKSWLVSVGAIGTYLHPAAGGAFTQAMGLGLLFILAAFPSCFLWLVFGASLQRLWRIRRAARSLSIGMGLLLAGTVLLLIR
jgi:threonine/homoserine/homoserine lactone efflux protein